MPAAASCGMIMAKSATRCSPLFKPCSAAPMVRGRRPRCLGEPPERLGRSWGRAMSGVNAAIVPDQDEDFEQAKTIDTKPRFFTNCGKSVRAAKPQPKLTRVNFAVSRLMEFCSERELQNQTGHSVYEWPLVVVKELLDNSLDACEEAEVAPDISVIVEQDQIIVQDNAGGMDAQTIASILDYTVRVSSREAYASPTRGAQGNALKTLLAMDYVLQGAAGDAIGVTIIESRGVAHRIEFRVDHINNQPKIIHTTSVSSIGAGTKFT